MPCDINELPHGSEQSRERIGEVMSFLAKVFGEAGATAAKGLLDGVGDLATKIRGAITGELPPELRAQLEQLAIEAERAYVDGQNQINIAEAKSSSIFVAGHEREFSS